MVQWSDIKISEIPKRSQTISLFLISSELHYAALLWDMLSLVSINNKKELLKYLLS